MIMKLKIILFSFVCLLCSCGTIGKVVNPFYEPPSDIALKGSANDNALNPESNKGKEAREVLEQVGSYNAAMPPEPVNPVMKPAVVRLMWVPDHLNSYGDLIPAHYYYIKILDDRWNLQDAFELESQLNRGDTNTSNLPYIRK